MRLTEKGNGVYEVQRCHQLDETEADNRSIVEVCNDPVCGTEDDQWCDRKHFWSVYEHQVECVADCPTEAIARSIADVLEVWQVTKEAAAQILQAVAKLRKENHCRHGNPVGSLCNNCDRELLEGGPHDAV